MANPTQRQHGDEGDGCPICESGPLFIFDWGWRTPGEDQARQLGRTLSTKLFHRDCKTCDSEEASASESSNLCAFCRHLRLRHLLRCVDPDDDEPPMRGTFVKFCRFENIPERVPFCSFCRLVMRAALPYRYFSGIASPADVDGDVVAISVCRGLLQTRVEYPDSWGGGRRIYFDDELSGTKQPRKTTEEEEEEEEEEESSSDSPRVGAIRPPRAKMLVGSHVDWGLALRWLEDCRVNHETCSTRRERRVGRLPVGFRLIDVNRRCIVEAQAENRRFVALSYVWGRHPDPTKLFATRSNRERLEMDGSLSALNLPRTIEDAIEACRQLGEGYLWVDRLCIIQDDLEDKGHQISAMAAIYSLAEFALIITDGDSDSGIAGISRKRAEAQMRQQISGFAFVGEPAEWRDIIGGESVWSTRGWTYQEAVLPRRKLYLSESQAVFACATRVADEDGAVQRAMYSPHGLNEQPWNPLYHTFYGHLASYRARSLTNLDDIYNAIDGIASALYGGSRSLLSGLPRQEFDEALLWCLDGHTDPTLQGAAFNGSSPSWSWSSTDRNNIALLDDENRRTIQYCETLVAWSRISQDGKSLESVRTTMSGGRPLSHFFRDENQGSCGCRRDKYEAKKDAERLLYSALAWSQGCIINDDRPCPFAQPHETTFAATRAGIRTRWSCRHRYWLEALRGVTTANTTTTSSTETETEAGVPPSPSKPGASTVFASVQSARFRLQGSVRRNKTSGRVFDDLCIVHPDDGQPAGLLVAGDPGLGLGPEATAADSTFEFIALSIGTSESIVLPDGRVKYVTKWDMGSAGDIEEDEEDEEEEDEEEKVEEEGEGEDEPDSASPGSRFGSEEGTQSTGEGGKQQEEEEDEALLGSAPEWETAVVRSQPDLGDVKDQPDRWAEDSRTKPGPNLGPEPSTESFSEPEPYLRSEVVESDVTALRPSPDQNSQQGPLPESAEAILSDESDEGEDERCKNFISLEDLQKLTFRDGAGKLLHPLPVVNVMMVERIGGKAVRRVSVGWIYLTSWIRAERKFETVFLE